MNSLRFTLPTIYGLEKSLDIILIIAVIVTTIQESSQQLKSYLLAQVRFLLLHRARVQY